MSSSTININHKWQYKDGSLEFKYSTLSSKYHFQKNKLTKILTNIFNDRTTVPTLIETTKTIKTIFREIDELSLEIYINKDKELEGLMYYQGNLVSYSYQLYSSEKAPIDIFMDYSYTPKKRVQAELTITDSDGNLKNPSQYQNIFYQKIEIIQQLQQVKPTVLSTTNHRLCAVYRLFYQENPNFSISETKQKTINMLTFLREFNISVEDKETNYNLTLNSKKDKLSSLTLLLELNELAPFGEITPEMSSIQLANWEKQTIKAIGKEIRHHMQKHSDPMKWFSNLVQINYIKKYYLPSKSSEQDIANFGNYQKDEVIKTLKLVKEIKKNVDNSN